LYTAIRFDYWNAYTWTRWTLEVTRLVGKQDPCFWKNSDIKQLFNSLEDRDLDKSHKLPIAPIAEIQAHEYSWTALKALSNDWTQPVVVRGLFRNASALQLWAQPDYLVRETFASNLTSVIGNGTIVKHYERVCSLDSKDRDASSFSTYIPFDEAISRISSGNSTETIVFPPASRSKRIRNPPLEERFNEMVANDLDLSVIGDAFSSGTESTILTQIFLGGGVSLDAASPSSPSSPSLSSLPSSSSSSSSPPPSSSSPHPLIGTGWHGDICNNFVIQVVGVKRWMMVDSKHASYLRPTMSSGKTAIVGLSLSIEDDTLPYIPHHEFDLYPGDFLYNPEWYFHSIVNHPVGPYALGLVSRQCHVLRNLKVSPLFTLLVAMNHAIASVHDVEARQRFLGLLGHSLMKPKEGINVAAKNEVFDGYTK